MKRYLQHPLDEVLENICINLQINETQYKSADDKYKAIGSWLDQDDILKSLQSSIYPQGSFNLGTTVKPIKSNEFDLDFIFQLNSDKSKFNPKDILKYIYSRIVSNGLYADKTKVPQKKCVTITFANNFHLDIVPAFPALDIGGTFIYIPDMQANGGNGGWVVNNPKGYADWFEDKCLLPLTLINKYADQESLPRQELINEKSTLKLVVQLFKRWRDIAYDGAKTHSPSSILLTTILSNAYSKEMLVSQAITNILNVLSVWPETQIPNISNPSAPTESLNKDWRQYPEKYSLFLNNIKSLKRKWDTILVTSAPNVYKLVEQIFGEDIVKKSVADYAQRIQNFRKEGILQTGIKGVLTANTVNNVHIPKNTFYGKDIHSK